MYEDYHRGVRFVYSLTGKGREQFDKTLKLFSTKKIDVVHCMGAGSSVFLPALINKLLLRKKFHLVVDYEDKQSLLVPPRKLKTHLFYEKLTYKYADTIICASNELAKEYKIKNKNTRYLPFGTNDGERNKSISKNNDNGVKLNLCYLGSMISPYKDQIEFLIGAVPHLTKQLGKIVMHIVGAGNLYEYFMSKVETLQLQGSVLFHGYVPDEFLDNLLSKMQVLVFPIPETPLNKYRCPNKIFLYSSTGLPIVTNKVGEVYNLLKDYPNATFFEENNYRSFAHAVLQASRLDHNVPEIFYKDNSWDNRADTYLDILEGSKC
jgi:glycosyltransferase involved in cell wall biosynthesis